jgi:predicted regulator of amino acid metabolism with ACT domain
MQRLSGNITEEVLERINKNSNDTNIPDPIQPIMDIICGALEKHDFETAGEGLEIIEKQIISVKAMQYNVEISDYSSYFCNHLQRIGTLAAKGEHGELPKKTLKILQSIVKDNSAEQGLEEAIKKIAFSLSAIGEASLRRNLRDATKQAAISLGFIGKSSANSGFNDATEQVAYYLGTIGKASVSKEVIKQIVDDLTTIGISVAEKGEKLENALWEVVLSLESVGIAVVDRKEDGEVAKDLIESLGKIAEYVYINLELKDAAWQIAKSMGSLGFVAADKGKELETVTKKVIKCLEDLGISVAAYRKKLESVSNEVADSLCSIGEASAEKGVKSTTSKVVSALKKLGREAIKKDFTDLAWLTAYSLGVVGTSAAENGIKLKDATLGAVLALNEIGESGPEIKDMASNATKDIKKIAAKKGLKEITEKCDELLANS